jgi:hypothetical protein
MSTLSPRQIFDQLRAVGYTDAAAIVQTAIALAESGGDDTNLGDVNLETATWGPSYGTYQIRTLKAETGSGSDRDVSWLAASDLNQAHGAYDISKHGTDFTPWSTYTSGAYSKFLPDARAAAAAGGGVLASAPGQVGPDWAPWNWGSTLDATTARARDIALLGLFVVLGLALLGLGVSRALRGRGGGGSP